MSWIKDMIHGNQEGEGTGTVYEVGASENGNSWLNAVFGMLGLGDLWNSLTGSGLTTAEIQQNRFNAEQAEINRNFNAEQAALQRDWQAQMDNTKVQRSVADMQAAGVNPAMMMGGSGVTAGTPSGAAASGTAASGSGGSRNGAAALSAIMDVMFAKQRYDVTKAQIANINADTSLKESEASRTSEETQTIRINNDYLREFNQLRNEGMSAANDVTREQLYEVRSNIRKLDSETILNYAKSYTEQTQQALNDALAMKANVDAYTAVELLPYQQALLAAQESNQRAQASFAFVQAAYQQGLIDNGYITNLCREMDAEANLQEFITSIKTGDPEGKVYEGKFAQFIGRTAAAAGALIEASGVGNIVHVGVNKSTSHSTVEKK